MNWAIVYEVIEPQLMTVVTACWALGFVLKRTPKVPDWSIVYIVTVFSIGNVVWLSGLTPEALMQGVMCGAISVYGHQLLKQGKKGADNGGARRQCGEEDDGNNTEDEPCGRK